ncbi:MAG: alpha/beta hydrolase [Thermodesulfobacteriota bacterium]|jgi:pimeloyl-ACP methyl ester carboxylesterase|nr:MAG: alpha/beta hydrolase [Thermodesulfobacteriota bacterium]
MIPKRLKAAVVIILIISLFGGCARFEQKLFDWGLCFERQRSDLVSRTIHVDGQNIAYLERPGEGQTIVLLHGFGANKDTWIRFVRYLPKKFRILAIDMPGHGDNSRNMDVSYDAQHLTDVFSRTVEYLGLQRFHLAGHSFGGYVAMRYAVNHPQKLITLGLFASAGVMSPTPTDFQQALGKGENPIQINSEKSFDRMMDLVFYKKPFAPWPMRPVIRRQCIERHEFEKKVWHDIGKDWKEATEFLPQIRTPVFLIWGDKDRILHISGVNVYCHYLPQAETAIIKNCGHGLIFEKPREAADAYANFLENVKTRE